MWSPYHSSLPASAFVEEKGEAVGEDIIITSVHDCHNIFVTLHHEQPGTQKPLTSPHITRESVRAMNIHLTRLLACIHGGTVPLVKKMTARPQPGARAANTLQATMEWPEDPSFPLCFNSQVADATFLYGAHRSLDVLFFSATRAES